MPKYLHLFYEGRAVDIGPDGTKAGTERRGKHRFLIEQIKSPKSSAKKKSLIWKEDGWWVVTDQSSV